MPCDGGMCDCDGDKAKSTDVSCGGDDCNDHDPNIAPGKTAELQVTLETHLVVRESS